MKYTQEEKTLYQRGFKMKIVNTTIEFEERTESNGGYGWDDLEYIWYGTLKMNGVAIFSTKINYIYDDDENQMSEQVLEAFADSLKLS
jgi:hypothetical protein